MTYSFKNTALLSPFAMLLASCSAAQGGDSVEADTSSYSVDEKGTFNEGWAMAFVPGTELLVITEKSGAIKLQDTATGATYDVSGAPEVDYGGQGGLGDIAFLPGAGSDVKAGIPVYLSWAEAGKGGRGAVASKGTMVCPSTNSCRIDELNVIWRQTPKTSKRGHFSHRLLFSPDEQHLYIASGDRQELDPAQDNSNTLGTIVKLNLDGTPAADNPWADKPSPTNQIWSWGHRNILGMDWDADGRLWEIEHGPAGGDELNISVKGDNYGWPTRSNGDHYNGDDIPDHTDDDGFVKPILHWTPVIAPGDMLIYRGDMFPAWQGDALVAGLSAEALVHIDLEGDSATEVERHEIGGRLRALAEGPDGAIWAMEDGEDGQLLKLSR